MAGGRGNRLFAQGLGHNENCCLTMFLAREIIYLGKYKLGGLSIGFGVPYRFYVGIKTEFFDFIE